MPPSDKVGGASNVAGSVTVKPTSNIAGTASNASPSGDSESTPKPQTSYVPLTEEQIDELRRQAKAALDPDHLPGRYDKRVDTLCDMAVNCLLYGEELERLRSAPYSWARRDAVESATASPVTSTTAPYANNVTIGDRLVCAHCGGEHFQAMKYFDYELSESDYPTEHPDRCRKLDGKFYDPPIIEDGQSRPHWRCHKKAGHSAGNGGEHCSTHKDCGARSADRHICGHEPDHDGPHAWEPSVAPEEERKKP